jgi:hypothetical protein
MSRPRLIAYLAAAALLLGGPAQATAAGETRRGETSAQRLHRKGVHCMEEIERTDCAIEHFEALLDERTEERELITDGLLRLIKLYEKAGDADAVHAVMRRFWEAGRGKLRRGHLPYTTRFLPRDFDVVGAAYLQRMLAAPLAKRLPPELHEFVITCDDDRRKELEELLLYRKADARAKLKNQSLQAALTEISAEERKQAAARSKRAAARDTQRPRPPKPVFADGLCATATAFGESSPATWTRIAIGFHHGDWRRSAAVLELPGLAARIAAGVQAGRLSPAGANTWTLVDRSYEGQTVQLASFELDELVIAPEALMREIAASHRSGKRSLAKEVDRLVAGVPVDTGFFAVATERAVRELGFGGMSKGRRKLLELLLPHPEGVQVAGVVHEYFGLFMRMPTDTPVKAGMLVDIVRRMITSQADADEDAAASLRLLDVAQASDKRALLLGYVLSLGQIETMLLD